MYVRSPAFSHEGVIPSKYTCDGEHISPPLAIDDIPEEAVSLVLILEDPDVPRTIREDGMWIHWLMFNMPPDTSRIGEGEVPPHGIAGITTGSRLAYEGPCPPDREHRYLFRVFALDTMLDLPEGASRDTVRAAMEGHVLESTTLMGRYARMSCDYQ
ncbi:MAG: YbhB/YbcL family Raf kinase inhibitor-like protein [Candidatus Pacebacteria bacterium]|nr:YbhB/YbcL family Raf kinase inhibitor-like protein [Candidatus Paceibacterota bacterium]